MYGTKFFEPTIESSLTGLVSFPVAALILLTRWEMISEFKDSIASSRQFCRETGQKCLTVLRKCVSECFNMSSADRPQCPPEVRIPMPTAIAQISVRLNRRRRINRGVSVCADSSSIRRFHLAHLVYKFRRCLVRAAERHFLKRLTE